MRMNVVKTSNLHNAEGKCACSNFAFSLEYFAKDVCARAVNWQVREGCTFCWVFFKCKFILVDYYNRNLL